ncbi:MAG: response regulator [Sphingomonas bacterium]|nr:response regulator [Sphingomonas bacterium]
MADQLLTNLNLLVVEDEMLVMMAIEDMLTDLGCTSIKVASSIDQALELIANNDFDLATIDLNLNGARSYPVARTLDARGVPFVFSTGYGEDGVGEGFGDRPVLTKPYGNFQLVTILTALLAATDTPTVAAA